MKHECSQIKEISTLKANQDNMADNIREIKDDVKEMKDYIIVEFPKIFATKQELESTKESVGKDIGWLKASFYGLAGSIGVVLLGILGYFGSKLFDQLFQ